MNLKSWHVNIREIKVTETLWPMTITRGSTKTARISEWELEMILMPYNLITFFNEAESLIKRGELFKKKKKGKRSPEWGHLLHITANQDLISNLITVSASPRNVTFNQLIRNYLISTNELPCRIEPHPSPKIWPCWKQPTVLETPLFHPFLPRKPFHLTAPQNPFLPAKWDAPWFTNH